MTAEYIIKGKKSVYTSQVQVEKTPEHLVLVALAGWGGEVFSINYDGNSIKTNSMPIPNVGVGIDHTLTDFILTYGDASLLKQMLKKTSIDLVDGPRKRVFLFQGDPIIKINYQHDDPWQGNVTIENLKYKYKINISTILCQKSIDY